MRLQHDVVQRAGARIEARLLRREYVQPGPGDPARFQRRQERRLVEALGPLTVGIDAHGQSLYDVLHEDAAMRMPAILAELRAEREAAAGEATEQ